MAKKLVYEGPERRYNGPERREGESESVYIGLPTWIRAVALIGLPSVIACFLIWVGAKYLPNIEAEITALKIATIENRLLYQEELTRAQETYRLLQRICSNVAKNDEERQKCFDK